MKLEEIILHLLGHNHCVTVPGLGSFIYREAPASANTFTFELKPSSRTVFFNNAIASDDGIMVNHVREQLGIGYNVALIKVNEMASELRENLDRRKNLPFGKLGNFFLNSENQFWRLRCCQLHHPCIW